MVFDAVARYDDIARGTAKAHFQPPRDVLYGRVGSGGAIVATHGTRMVVDARVTRRTRRVPVRAKYHTRRLVVTYAAATPHLSELSTRPR